MKRMQDFSQVELLTENQADLSWGILHYHWLEDGMLISSPLVVGAEGKDSSVRQTAWIET